MKRKMLPIIALLIILLSVLIGATACSEEEIPVERIALTSLPKLEYLKGEAFEVNDAQLAIYYANGRRDSMPLSFEMVSNYNPQEIGEHVLTINYENVVTNIKIRISNAPITTIEPTEGKLPYKTSYIESQDLDISNLHLKINYQSGDPDIIPVTQDMVTGYDRDVIGEQQVTITYLEQHTTSYTVQVRQKQVSNISINHPPNKWLYLLDERIEFDKIEEYFGGGELFVSYDNGYTEYIDFVDLFQSQAELDEALEYDTSRPVNREIVRMNYADKSVIFDIRVLIKGAEIFDLISLPSGVQVVGTSLSLEGGELFITYNNETTETVYMTDEKVSYSGYDMNTVGEQEITLSFNDISEKYTFLIEVVDATPIELEVLTPVLNDENQPVPYSYVSQSPKTQARFYQEGVIDLALWEYRLKMDNDTYSDIYPVSQNMLQEDSSHLELEDYGIKTLTFKYIRESVELEDVIELNVDQKLLDEITVTPPENNIFYRGEPIVLGGATFTAYFNDGTSYSDIITIEMISGYNNNQTGEQDVAVTYATEKYGSKVAFFRVLVIRKAMYIEFVSALKTEYVIGEEFSLDGLVMRIHYEGYGQPENFGGPFGEEWSFNNTQFDNLGDHNVIVEYQAVGLVLDTVIPITVRNELTDIALVRSQEDDYEEETILPEVVVGLDIDLSGLYLELTLENGIEYIPLTKSMLNYQRANRELGKRQVTINYQGFSIITSVNVIYKQISSLVFLEKPFREYYKSNEEEALEIDGLEMRLYFTNETSVQLNEARLHSQDSDTLEYRYFNQQGDLEKVILSITELDSSLDEGVDYETRTIEISITEYSVSRELDSVPGAYEIIIIETPTDEYAVSFDVIVAYRIATDITWDISDSGEEPTDQPEIIAYQGLDEIALEGLQFKVVFNQGEFYEIITIGEDSIDDISIVDFNHNAAGVQNIYLRYQDILLSTIITVRQKDLLTIEKAPDFYVPDVTEGMNLDLRQAKILVTYYHNMGEEDDIILDPTVVSLSTSMINYDKTDLNLGTRTVIITFSYTGTETVTETAIFNVMVEQKQLLDIKMGSIPKTKYIELDQYEYYGGTVILYYNNNTTTTLSLSDAKRVVSSMETTSTDTFILNYGQFNNENFSGFSRKQQIFITYIEGDATVRTSYDIIMHDRMYMQVVFDEVEQFNEEDNTYYFWYGEDREINYQILGYSEHTDQPEGADMVTIDLEIGINYIFKYINVDTGEEFGSWPKDAGTYTIYISYNADSVVNNDRIHNSFEVSNRKLVIRPKNIHIIPDAAVKVYGENNPQFTSQFFAVEYRELSDGSIETIYHSDNVFGYDETKEILGELTYLFFNSGGAQIDIVRKTSVGMYAVKASIEPQRNYFVTIDEADFEIIKREIILLANSHEKEYGESDPTFTYTTAAVMGNPQSGLIEGDSFDGFLLRPSPSSNNNVGEYNILLVTPNNPNYQVQYVGNTLTINKRNLYLTVGDYTKIYGEQLPQFSVSPSSDYANPFAYSDTMSSLLGELEFLCMDGETPVGAATGVGVYDVIAQGLTSFNYQIIYNSGILTIERRQIEVRAFDTQKIYGEEEDPQLLFSVHSLPDVDYSGIYGEDTLIGDLSREPGEIVDDYSIEQGAINNVNNPNYDITFVNGIFSITKRDAQIEILVSSREYDGEFPYILDEEYDVHNAYGDIKDNINIIFGSNASPNVGSYSVNFETTDPNHNLSLLNPEGYWLQITRRQVRTEFYNIPYGQLIEGEYTGSVYKGSPYYYESRVKQSDIIDGDNVSVTVQTAVGENPQDYNFENRNNAMNVGFYTVRAYNLSNNNYQMIIPSSQEIEEDGDYRYTAFEIIPAEIKIFITIDDMSKTYTGSEISFHNVLSEEGGYYKTNDYTLLTAIDFVPHGLNVYPYYINPQNNQERLPRVVRYSMTEGEYDIVEGEYVIIGYNIKAVTGNDNYTAVIVDEFGEPLERDEQGEISEEEYRFKIIPQTISVTLWQSGVNKIYDGQAPSIGVDDFVLSSGQISKETEVSFEFIRRDYPEFMEGYIEDKDSGLFEIKPSTTNMNYRLELAENSQYDYEIKVKTLGPWRIGETNLRKQYDNLGPVISSQQLVFDYYDGSYIQEERSNLHYELDFGGVTSFDVGSYPFTLKFSFPTAGMDHSQDETYKDHMDFNHKFSDSSTLERTFIIQPRQVSIQLLDGEGYNWKYYNGLSGSELSSGEDLLPDAFRIVDARYYEPDYYDYMMQETGNFFSNGDPIRIMHLLNDEDTTNMVDIIDGQLELSFPFITNAGTSSSISSSYIRNNNPNFNIQVDNSVPYTFNIARQEIYYHFDDFERPYGETLSIEDYVFALTTENLNKIAEGGTVETLFGTGGLFDRQYLNPRVIDDSSGGSTVTSTTPVGFYRPEGNDRNTTNYRLIYDHYMSENRLEITRRELPVEYVNSYNDGGEELYTIARIYGDSAEELIFNYGMDTGDWGIGLLSEDEQLIDSASFDLPQVTFVEGVGDDIYRSVGVIEEDALSLNYNLGDNNNYYFTYDAFNGVDPRLEIIKADLQIQLIDNDTGLATLNAEYGDPPLEADYHFDLTGLKLNDTINNIDMDDFSIYLAAETVEIGGEPVQFPSSIYSESASGYYLADLLAVNLALPVNFDQETMTVQSHFVNPYIGFTNITIMRRASDGIDYPYVIDLLSATMKNYNFLPLEAEYVVTPREIDIYLELLHGEGGETPSGEDAVFNILYGEEPYLITDEMVLQEAFTNEEILLKYFDKLTIAFAGLGIEQSLLIIREKRDILYNLNIISEHEYNTLGQAQIDQIYEDEVTEQLLMNNLQHFDFTEQDGEDAYDEMTPSDFDTAYDELMTDQVASEIYSNEKFTDEELEIIYADIINSLNLDEQRLVFRFRYDDSRVMSGDTVGAGGEYSIDLSNLHLVYDSSVGEDKTIRAEGATGYRYSYNYVESAINIYNYVTTIGYDNELPNIMLKAESDEFVIRVNYADGDHEYLSYNNPLIPEYNVQYIREFEYISGAIDQLLIGQNQQITIEYNEVLFGYKEFSVMSQPFEVRMFSDEDELYWSKGKSLPNDYTGGTFISSNDTRDIGEKIDQNYSYYISEYDGVDTIKAMYNFDIVNTAFRLSPKDGMTDYYFDIILNGDQSGDDYMRLRFRGGQTQTVTLITNYIENTEILHTQSKPGQLDLFDGRTHEVTAYIDKLGTRQSDPSGYRVIVVIDNTYYFSYALGKGDSYQPYDNSVAGFLASDTYAWVSKFDVYAQGLVSSRVLKVMPNSTTYYSHHYSITDGSGEIYASLRTLVESFSFPNSAYRFIDYDLDRSYEIRLDGNIVDDGIVLTRGIYVMEVDLYFDSEYMDTMTTVITVSENYRYENIFYQGSTNTPYMTKPLEAYGYTYDGLDDSVIIDTEEANLYALNNKDYRYVKTVVDIDFASFAGGIYPDVEMPAGYDPFGDQNWEYPYSAAIILKNTDIGIDLRNASVSSSDFHGIGIYIRYDGDTGIYYTRIFVRVAGNIYYTQEYYDINWQSQQRTVVEAHFVEETASIYIQIHNENDTYSIRLGNRTSMASGQILNTSSLLPLITASSTAGLRLKNTKATIYQMETGFRTIAYNNFINYDTGEFISNISGGVEFGEGDRIFIDNGSGLPMVSDYSKYSITFKAEGNYTTIGSEYFRFIVGANKPTYEKTINSQSKVIYLAYRKESSTVNTLSFGFDKQIYEYRSQVLYADKEYQSYLTGPDLLDGEEHTIDVIISRESISYNDPNYVVQSTSIYTAEIFVDGSFVGTGYIPVSNDLSTWMLKGGGSGLGGDTTYDHRFLNSTLYAGFEVKTSQFELLDLLVY